MGTKKKNIPSDPRLDADFDEATQLLEGKSQLLDNIMDSIGDGLSIQDRNMRIVYQNKVIIESFGSHIGEQCYKVYEADPAKPACRKGNGNWTDLVPAGEGDSDPPP